MDYLKDIDKVMKGYLYNKDGRKIIINTLNSFLYSEYVRHRKYVFNTPNERKNEYSFDTLLNDIRRNINKSYYHGFPRYPFKWKHNKNINKFFEKHNIPFRIVNIITNPELEDNLYPTYEIKYVGEFEEIDKYSDNHLFDVYILDYIYMIFDAGSRCYSVIDDKMAKTLDEMYTNITYSYVLSKYISRNDVRSLSFWNETFFKIFNMPFFIEQKIDMGHKYYLISRTDNV